MNRKYLGLMLCSLAVAATSVTPALAMDYEAKPVNWVLQAPARLLGAVSAGIWCGAINAPIDDGYHGFLKGTTHVAGKFGDEKGAGQIAMAVPIGGSTGLVLGSLYGVHHGWWHGVAYGWKKPFSRWSYMTSEEK